MDGAASVKLRSLVVILDRCKLPLNILQVRALFRQSVH
jgi:hypothetical protein